MQEAFNRVVEKLESWGATFVSMLPNLAVALVVVLVFWLLGRLARRAVRRAAANVGKRETVIRLLGSATWALVLTVGLFVALGVLRLDRTVTSLLAGAGILGLAAGFAIQNTATSLMAGVLLSLRGKIRIGDLIETNDKFGTVEEIELRTTSLRTLNGQLAVIPNKEILEQPLVNHTAFGEFRVDIEVGVTYSADLDQVQRVTTEALEGVSARDDSRPVEVFYTGFGGSSIDLVGRFWIPFTRNSDAKAAMSEGVVRIKKAYDAAGISIPFPIRTLDFAGEDLEALAGGGGQGEDAGGGRGESGGSGDGGDREPSGSGGDGSSGDRGGKDAAQG